jgi:hypothetical protein
MLKDLRQNLPLIRDALRELPAIIHHLGEQAAEGGMKFDLQSSELQRIREQLAQQRRQRYWLAAAATAFITGALLMTLGTVPALGWSLLAAGAVSAYLARP